MIDKTGPRTNGQRYFREQLLFVSWAPFCSRSDNIARELGGRSVMIYHGWWGSNYATILFKYFTQFVSTLVLLVRARPRVVFVMTPPAVACLPVLLYCTLTGARWVIDAHSATFNDARWAALAGFQRFLSRRAVTTIVTNTHWQALVRSWGARSDIVQDVPIAFAKPGGYELPNGPKIATVCTFTFDEPIESIFRAAALAPEVRFFVTGNPKRVPRELLSIIPPNLTLTGFLPDAAYVSLLEGCTAVLCLTRLDHTMQRAAYEAAYLGRPIITSDFGLLREAFSRGTIFVTDDPRSIADGVKRMVGESEAMLAEARELKSIKLRRWAQVRHEIAALVGLEYGQVTTETSST